MQGSAARAVITYNLCRLGLFVGCALLGALAGLRGLLLIATALLVSGVLSWFLLARQRAAMADVVGSAVTRGRVRLAARTEAEDAYVDAVASEPKRTEGGVTRTDR